jgi:hypothetical protein
MQDFSERRRASIPNPDITPFSRIDEMNGHDLFVKDLL